MKKIAYTMCALLLGACSTSYKELPELESVSPKIDLATQWVVPAGSKHPREYRQLPTISSNGTAYVANASRYVAALDTATGKLKWQVRLAGARLISGPGYGDNTLVLVNEDAFVIALDSHTGKEKWRLKATTEVISNPSVAQGKVLIQSVDGRLTTIDVNSGKIIWSEKQAVPALTLRGGSSPLVMGDVVVGGFANGKLIAFTLATGKVLWELPLAVPRGRTDLERMVDVDGQLVASGNIIYAVSYNGRVAAISAQNGRIVWSREMSSYTGITVANKKLYLSDAKGYVWALDVNTGATMWRQESLIERELSVPVVVGQAVVVGDVSGNIHWLSQDDGDFLARVNLKDVYFDASADWGDENVDEWDFTISAAPFVDHKNLLVRDNAGSLAMFEIIEPEPKSELESEDTKAKP